MRRQCFCASPNYAKAILYEGGNVFAHHLIMRKKDAKKGDFMIIHEIEIEMKTST